MTHEEVLDEVNVIYERLSHPEDCENGVYSFSDGNYTEALEVLIDYYEVGLIEELEKIRTEIEQIVDEEQKHDKKWAIGLRYSLKIIDKHISEMRGE